MIIMKSISKGGGMLSQCQMISILEGFLLEYLE